jgi:hypothetical protein
MPMLVEPTVHPAHTAHGTEGAPWAALVSAHTEAIAAVAEFDLDDSTLWQQVDSLVADTAGAAYALTQAVTGEPAPRPTRGIPAVVRVRELATAQRRLFAALDRNLPLSDDGIDRATRHVRALSREFRCAAQSLTACHNGPKPGSDDERGGRRS